MKLKQGRKVGGHEEFNGVVHDNTSKVQHHAVPQGHGEALAKAKSASNKEAKPAPQGAQHGGPQMKEKMPGIGEKASGKRITSEAYPAPKAKRQSGY